MWRELAVSGITSGFDSAPPKWLGNSRHGTSAMLRMNGLGLSCGIARSASIVERGKSGLRRRPGIDPLQRPAHQGGPIAFGQAVGDAERLDALLICEQSDGAGPVGPPQAAIEAEGIEDAAERVPYVLVRVRLTRQRAGSGNFDRDVGELRQLQHLREL